jgi:anaerobic magnesium-protoporphyrin IX monomethyl ester cyclase
MKLLLLFPSSKEGVKSFFLQTEGEGIGHKPPLGLLYIASYIKKYSDHQVQVWDLDARPIEERGLMERLRSERPDVIGISCWTDFWYPVCRLMKVITEALPQVHITLGGPHVGVYPALCLAQAHVDSIVLGDGEKPMQNLLDHLQNGSPLMDRGIYVKRNLWPERFDQYIEKELDHLPFPDRTLLPVEDYSSVLSSFSRITTMITSRGCPHRCVYCKLHFQKTLCRSSMNVVDELQEISRLGYSEVEIYDDTFTWSKSRLREICTEMVKRRVHLRWAIRERVSNVDEESLFLMKRAGLRRIHLGIESGNEAILKNIKKNITLEQAERAVKLAKRQKLNVLAYYMIGLPGESLKEVLETIDFAIRLDSDYAEFNVAIPYPGTEMYEKGLENKIIPRDFWKEFTANPTPDFVMPYLYEEHLSKGVLLSLSKLAIRKYYFRPRVIGREILGCASFGEFFRKAQMGWSLLLNSFLRR